MIPLPDAPYTCDFITDLSDNISDYVHKTYYKTDKKLYDEYNKRLDVIAKEKDFRRQRSALYYFRSELLRNQ